MIDRERAWEVAWHLVEQSRDCCDCDGLSNILPLRGWNLEYALDLTKCRYADDEADSVALISEAIAWWWERWDHAEQWDLAGRPRPLDMPTPEG